MANASNCKIPAASTTTVAATAQATQASAPIAAFVQPDAVTHKPPHGAFTLKRDGKVVTSEVLLQPCDRVEFLNRPLKYVVCGARAAV